MLFVSTFVITVNCKGDYGALWEGGGGKCECKSQLVMLSWCTSLLSSAA